MLFTLIFCLTVNAHAAPPPTAPPRRQAAADRLLAASLEAFVVNHHPPAARYAGELARRIVVEGRRHRIPPVVLTAIAWIESDFRRRRAGRHQEHGIFQVRTVDHLVPTGWKWIRARPAEFPIVHRVAAAAWRRLPHGDRVKVLRDIRAAAYLAGLEIADARRICYRMRNRPHRAAGRWLPTSHWYRHQRENPLAVWAHYNSGPAKPRRAYVAKLTRRVGVLRRWVARSTVAVARPAQGSGSP